MNPFINSRLDLSSDPIKPSHLLLLPVANLSFVRTSPLQPGSISCISLVLSLGEGMQTGGDIYNFFLVSKHQDPHPHCQSLLTQIDNSKPPLYFKESKYYQG
ncbi:hypothetical protein CLU79DRAFT_775156 [Phycomyces nitens]|nr:hypothetical protein CLU79DRAFT_775156 [Phycomyces nitens]